MIYSYVHSSMLKPASLIKHVYKEKNKAQEKLFKHVCNYGAWSEWRNGRRAVSSYIDVDTSKD